MNIHLINYSTGSHFDEIQSALISGFSAHCNIALSRSPKDSGINIVLGANVLAMQGRRIVFPGNTIIYNLEQLGHNSLWDSTFYMDTCCHILLLTIRIAISNTCNVSEKKETSISFPSDILQHLIVIFHIGKLKKLMW